MRAGRLDRRITIQRKATTQNEWGEPVEMWLSVSHRRAAGKREMDGQERFTADQWVGRQQVEFTIRHIDLGPLDRIIYPAPLDENVQEPSPMTIYDIMGTKEIGRGKGFWVKTARRTEG